jgi:hypothetical protein
MLMYSQEEKNVSKLERIFLALLSIKTRFSKPQ